jgi:hypothetical protein
MFQKRVFSDINYINAQTIWGWSLAQVVEHLLGKHEILRLNPNTTNNNKSVSIETTYKHISFNQRKDYQVLGVILIKC